MNKYDICGFDKHEELSKLHNDITGYKLDSYIKDMLFKNIINEYSDAEQLDIIEYLVQSLIDLQGSYKENSIEEVYVKGLEKVLKDIQDLEVKEHDFLLDN